MYSFSKILTICLIGSQLLFSCKKNDVEAQSPGAAKGLITGRVTDDGQHPLAGVKVVAEHTVFYNTYKTAVTGADGRYQIEAGPSGSWKPSAVIQKNFDGINYEFDLDPSNSNPINAEGGTCDFTWKLTGPMPGGDPHYFYGASIRLYPQLVTDPADPNDRPFDLNDLERVEIKVIDGTVITGSPAPDSFRVFRSVNDISGQATLTDMPVGKYQITARLKNANGTTTPLKIALIDPNGNESAFAGTAVVSFREQFGVRRYGARIVVDY